MRTSRTDTPLQALNLLDGERFLEAARFMGQRMLREGGNDDASRLRYGFRLALARYPTAAEVAVLRDDLQFQREYFSDPGKTNQYLHHGESLADTRLNSRELAAYAAVGSLILNLDETVTKE